MANGSDFIRLQNNEIESLRVEFHAASVAFKNVSESDAAAQQQTEHLRRMYECGTKYYRCVENSLLDHDDLAGEDFDRWLHDRVGSALSVLNGLPKYYAHLRAHRERLGLPNGMFEPSPGVFRNMQSVLAACQNDDANKLKTRFLELNLPTTGFDQPFMPKPPAPKKTRWWLVPVYIIGILLLLVALAITSHYVSPWLFIPILIGVIILITIVGAFQLKNDDRLADKPFVELMGLALKKKFEFFTGPRSKP